MQVNAARLAPLSQEEHEKLMREGRCVRCCRQGRRANRCPQNENQQNRPINNTGNMARNNTNYQAQNNSNAQTSKIEEIKLLTSEDLITHIKALSDEESDKLLKKIVMMDKGNEEKSSQDF